MTTQQRARSGPPLWAIALAFASLGAAAGVGATSPKSATPPAAYTEECGACHTAYPAQLLPKASWQRVMAGLDTHYGSNASLDAGVHQSISTWLQAQAGQGKRAQEEPPQDRITRSAWFVREHREINAAVYKRPSIKSAANCSACHSGAAKGNFEEDSVRIPK